MRNNNIKKSYKSPSSVNSIPLYISSEATSID